MSKDFQQYQKLCAKDIQKLLVNVNERTAYRYLTDIKREFSIKIVTYHHFKLYFKITHH